MANGYRIWERLTDPAVYDSESFHNETIVEVVGHRRVLIENHRGVAAYEKDKLLVNVPFGSVSICGQALELTHMTKDQLVICGMIHAVALQRRENS